MQYYVSVRRVSSRKYSKYSLGVLLPNAVTYCRGEHTTYCCCHINPYSIVHDLFLTGSKIPMTLFLPYANLFSFYKTLYQIHLNTTTELTSPQLQQTTIDTSTDIVRVESGYKRIQQQ